jgi:trehalose synthase
MACALPLLGHGVANPITRRSSMTRLIEPDHHVSLEDYERVAHLSVAVRTLREEAASLLPRLQGRRVWMVNSASHGGGVAEMLPPLLTLMRDLGVDARWLVMETDEQAYFRLTKRLHNLIHGQGDPSLDDEDRELYARVSRETADAIADHLEPGDVLVVHDPQPAGAGAIVRQQADIAAIWRCHIGLDEQTPETRAAWDFLDRYLSAYDHAVFSAPEYIPADLTSRSTIIHPAIDPLSHKNRELPIHKLVGILANGSLVRPFGPVLTSAFAAPAQRLQTDGGWAPATEPEDIGLLFRPIISQVSRWDRLKGWLPLLEGFLVLKQTLDDGPELHDRYRRSLELVRLVLAGHTHVVSAGTLGEVGAHRRQIVRAAPPLTRNRRCPPKPSWTGPNRTRPASRPRVFPDFAVTFPSRRSSFPGFSRRSSTALKSKCSRELSMLECPALRRTRCLDEPLPV